MRKMLITLAALTASAPLAALEIDPHVPPEIVVGGRALGTVDLESEQRRERGRDTDSGVNIEDTSLLFGLSKYLHDDAHYGFGAFGLKALGDSEINDSVFLHQAFGGVGGDRWEVRIGRTNLPNMLLRFPTIRDDDLLRYTHVPNARLEGESDTLTLYGEQLAADWYFTPLFVGSVAATARPEGEPASADYASFNGGAISLRYYVPETVDVARGLTFAGVLVDFQDLDRRAGERDGNLVALTGALGFNLTGNPEALMHLDTQVIWTDGESVTGLDTPLARARTDSLAGVASLRYRHRPYLQQRWQAALTVAGRDYRDFSGARSYAIAPSMAWRLGNGVDLMTQVVHERYDGDAARGIGLDHESRIQVGVSFVFDHTFNPSVGRRDDILRLEHDMLWPGPGSPGGH